MPVLEGATAPANGSDETRRRIVEAVAHVASTEHPTAFSVPAVARAAGVSVRTVYRYFATKEELLDGLNDFGGPAATSLLDPDRRVSLDEYLDAVPALWRSLHDNKATVQLQQASPLGREARARRVAERRARILAGVRAELPELTAAGTEALADALTILGSAVTLFELTDSLGVDPDGASALAVWSMRALLDAARRAPHDVPVHHAPEVPHG